MYDVFNIIIGTRTCHKNFIIYIPRTLSFQFHELYIEILRTLSSEYYTHFNITKLCHLSITNYILKYYDIANSVTWVLHTLQYYELCHLSITNSILKYYELCHLSITNSILKYYELCHLSIAHTSKLRNSVIWVSRTLYWYSTILRTLSPEYYIHFNITNSVIWVSRTLYRNITNSVIWVSHTLQCYELCHLSITNSILKYYDITNLSSEHHTNR